MPLAFGRLQPEEAEALDKVLADLETLAGRERIPTDELSEFIGSLKTPEAKNYVTNLMNGSKPEVALREAFLSGESLIGRVLASGLSPEVFVGNGFVDYQLNLDGRKVHLELKPLLEAQIRAAGPKRDLEGLRQASFDWRVHTDQVLRYVRSGARYVLLTNLSEWVFFDDGIRPASVIPFHQSTTRDLVRDLRTLPDLYEQLDRYKLETVKYELNESFYASLRSWVARLSKVEFTCSEQEKLRVIIGLINRFIFIQTLDDYRVIEFRWIRRAWEHATKRWHAKGESYVLRDFLTQINDWFNEYYDTELFRDNPLDFLAPTETAAKEFTEALSAVLGIHSWDSSLIGYKGIAQYNFKFIDRDIFGKAYETFLAEVRVEEGIFYTPAEVTDYIVRDSLGAELDDWLGKLRSCLQSEGWPALEGIIGRLVSVTVIDPACGSGSFLTRALRILFEKYLEAEALLLAEKTRVDVFGVGLERRPEVERQIARLDEGLIQLASGDDRERLAKILLRHIFGNEKDSKALEIAKVNLWLEAIKAAPEAFRFDRLPKGANHVLPDLRCNLTCGDALLSQPTSIIIDSMVRNSGAVVRDLQGLRRRLLEHPTDPSIVEAIVKVREEEHARLQAGFLEYVTTHKLPPELRTISRPLFWPLEHWHVFFDDAGQPLENHGFDVVIGNPPWVSLTGPRAKSDAYVAATLPLFKLHFETAKDQIVDTCALFLERSLEISHTGSRIGNILPDVLLLKNYPKLRTLLLDTCRIVEITHCGRLFVDASIDTIVLFLTFTGKPVDHEMIRIHLNLQSASAKTSVPDQIQQGEFRKLPKAKFNIWLADPAKMLLKERLEGAGRSLKSFLEIHEGIHSGNIRKKLFVDRRVDTHCRPLIFGRDEIDRYVLEWGGKYVDYDPAIIDEKKKEYAGLGKPSFFEPEKLVIRRTGDYIVAAYDPNGFYVSNNMFVGLPRDAEKGESILLALLGFLNSSLATYYFRLTQPRVGRLFAEMKIEHLYGFPVSEGLISDQELICATRRLVDTRAQQRRDAKIWRTWQKSLSTDSISLSEILQLDRRILRESGGVSTWSRSVPFFPGSPDAAALAEVTSFDVIEEGTAGLKIIGQNDTGGSVWSYQIEFDDERLRQHTFLAISNWISGKARAGTLDELLDKVMVPVIKPNIASSTGSIVDKVIQERNRSFPGSSIAWKAPPLPLRLDTVRRELEATIDAVVFRDYGVSKDDVNLVLAGVGASERHRAMVLELLDK